MLPKWARRILLLPAIPVALLLASCKGFWDLPVGSTVSTTTLTASSTTATLGATVTLTAMVSPSAATGTVTFYDGTGSLGTRTLNSGSVAQSAHFYTPGVQTLTATYNGNSIYASSRSSDVKVTVGSPGSTATTTTLSLSSSTIAVGSTVTLTAAVTPLAATGQISFYNGSTRLGTALLSSGSATLTQLFSTTGTQTLRAVYSGDPTYASSTSANETLTIN